MTSKQLPSDFLQELADLEAAYLRENDPIRQSGFGGGPERWRAEREPILNAVEADGDFLDIGCANGYLLECLVEWGRERGLKLTPYGLDQGTRLIELARQRLPGYADNFFVANAWNWSAPSRPRRFQYVYTLYDCVPEEVLAEYVHHILERIIAPGGRLIVGAYGSRSRGTPPFEIARFLLSAGWRVSGTATGGDPPIAAFAWIDA
ncbi:MAG: class I SAM-dependent methyltransferase [Ardenticatenaceae bacterium]